MIFFQFTLFLVIGTILYVDYRDRGLAAPKVAERIYPDFIWNNLPAGVAGLVMAAVLAAAMSNLSAALNALASTTVMDFLKAWSRTVRPESHYMKVAKLEPSFGGWFCLELVYWRAIGGGCWKRGFRLPPSSTERCWECFCWAC